MNDFYYARHDASKQKAPQNQGLGGGDVAFKQEG